LECRILLEIGYTYYFLEQVDKSIEFGNRVLEKAIPNNFRGIEGTAYNMLGIIYIKKKDGKKAMSLFDKALSIRKELNDQRGISSTLSNIALQYEEDGDYERALDYQHRSLAIDDSLQNLYGISWSYQMTGALLTKMTRFTEAEVALQKAESLAHQLQAREVLLQTYRSKSKLYAAQRKLEDALRYSEEYNTLRDSIYNSGLAGKVLLLQQSYAMNERDRKITLQQGALEAQRKFFIALGLVFVLLLVLLFFLYKSFRKARVLNIEIAEQKEEIQAQSEELTESNQTIHELNEHLEEEVKRKSLALVETNEELVRHNNELLQFSYTVSHNLRGPVARLLGLMNLITINSNPEEKDSLLKLLQQSTIDLDVVLKDLNLIIDLRNRIYKVREKIVLEEEWQKSCSLLDEYILPEFSIQADFSAQPYVYSIRAIIQNIFYNLLSNAIKYRSSDRTLSVKLVSRSTEEGTFLTVSDNGLGIDLANQRDNVFKLYKRFHMHVAGKGLGLYLVKTQIEVLEGTISVESELNKGTTFSIFFPKPKDIEDQVIMENEAVRFCYDANINSTLIYWKRPITSAEYRNGFETILQTLRSYNTPSWIADLRKQGSVDPEDQKWFMNSVLPEAVRCGLKRIGVIGFTKPIRKVYYEKMVVRSAELNIELKVFDTLEHAKDWLKASVADNLHV
jgi:signal transduction histidine kinase